MDSNSDKKTPSRAESAQATCSAGATEIVNKGLGGRWIRCLKCKQARKITNQYVSGQFKRAHAKSCEASSCHAEPVGARSGETFTSLYEMSISPRMEWSKRTGDPIYYHAGGCKAQRNHECGQDCMGSFGAHIAKDASDIRLAGWKPNDQSAEAANMEPKKTE